MSRHPPKPPKPPKPTTLCADCEGLRLNDEACGGFMGFSDAGTPRLRFEKEETKGYAAGILKLLMSQQRTDSSPGFPMLAKSGCSFCGFLRTAILRANVQVLQQQTDVSIHLAYAWGMRNCGESDEEGLQALDVEVCDAQGATLGFFRFPIYFCAGGDATADWLGLVSLPPRPESLCPENVSFIKRAIESCATDCHPPTKTSFSPTRLLDIGIDPTADPRLIISADLLSTTSSSTSIQYAAVSYCWGNAADALAQTKTTPANLHERLHGIPLYEMSTIMQDSIAVCKALSIRYLWIDALCIIQNPADPSDWERESERVGQVYQHAYFTICAMSPPSCHQSFLARSQHTIQFDFQSSLYLPARGQYTLHFAGLSSGVPVFEPLLIDFYNSLWDKRGWVYQERELSPRKLLFGQHMVHFECSRKKSSENGETFSQDDGVGWSHWTNLAPEQVYRGFREAIRQYSSRSLSYESDRLPALAGVAQRVFECTGSKYLAGLWMEDLHIALLWVAKGPGIRQSLAKRLELLRASRDSGAPSWSWVSHPGYIEHSLFACLRGFGTDSHLRPEYSSIEGWTALKGAGLNQFGEVRSGTIRIRSKVLPVPADFVLKGNSNQRLTICQRSDPTAVVAYCCLDWMESSADLPGRLGMLLLCSGCNMWEDDEADDEQDKGNGGQDEDIEDAQGNESEDEDAAENDDEDEGDPCQRRGLESGIHSPSPDTASEDGETCAFCNDEKHNRHVLGLIVHPAETTGEYYRVGVFESRANHAGGEQLFDGLEDVWIEIV